MPLLNSEPSLFPAELLSGSLASSDRQWWAIYTKARQEKALARQLFKSEIPFFLPLIPKENIIRGRRIRSHLPLFAGYLFLYASPEERVRTLTTNRISQILEVIDQEQLFLDLRQVHAVIEAGVPLTVESRLAPGQRVRVKHGAFSGMEGKIIERRGGIRLLIAVNYLQRGLSIEIEDMMVEPI